MKLSVIVPSLDGRVPRSLVAQAAGRPEVEIVPVVGVRPVGKARNAGLKRTTGEYVAWVDADDEVTPDWLETILLNLESSPDALLFDAENDGWPNRAGDFVYGKPNATVGEVVADMYEDDVLYSHLWRTVTRRDLWKNVAFDEHVREMEDYLVLPKVVSRAGRIVCVPKRLYRYHYGNRTIARDAARCAETIRVAIRRWNASAREYRAAAERGAVAMVYGECRVCPTHEGVRFLRQHCLSVRCGLTRRLRLVCAGLNFWLPQRLASWWRHGGKRGVR